LREQFLDIQEHGRKIILINKINIDEIVRNNYQERLLNPTGDTIGKTMKKIASIPVDVLQTDQDGIYFMDAQSASPECLVALTKFLSKNPEYKASNVRL